MKNALLYMIFEAVSNNNPYSESLFGTMKLLAGVSIEAFQQSGTSSLVSTWVCCMVQWAIPSGSLRFVFVTPDQRHRGEDVAILAARKALYEQARQRRPERRWSGDTRKPG